MNPYDSLEPHIKWLRMAAKAMRREGYDGWSNTCERAADAIEAVAPMLVSARVPEGWQLVPVEPTVEMMRAGDDTGFHAYTGTWSITPNACWQAMLTAAPKPETEE